MNVFYHQEMLHVQFMFFVKRKDKVQIHVKSLQCAVTAKLVLLYPSPSQKTTAAKQSFTYCLQKFLSRLALPPYQHQAVRPR